MYEVQSQNMVNGYIKKYYSKIHIDINPLNPFTLKTLIPSLLLLSVAAMEVLFHVFNCPVLTAWMS